MKRCLIYFFAGCVVAIVGLMVVAIISPSITGVVPFDEPRFFGDIKIWVGKPGNGQTENYDNSEVLFMAKEGVPFLQISRDNAGEVSKLVIYDEKGEVQFSMEPAVEKGQWEHFTYAGQKRR